MKKLFLFSFLAMAFGVSFGQVNVVLRGSVDTAVSLASRHRLDSIAALKVNVADSTVKFLTPTQLGFVAGVIDTAHIPSLDASKIKSGVIDAARIPNAAAPATYVISTDGTTVTAHPRAGSGYAVQSGTTAATVINNAIAAMTGAGTIYFQAGTYTISTSIVDNGVDGITLIFESGAKLVAANALNTGVIHLTNVNNWRIINPEIDGNSSNQSAPGTPQPNGIWIHAGNNVMVSNPNVYNCREFGVDVDGISDNCGVENGIVHDCGWNCVQLGENTTGTNLFCKHVEVYNAGDVGISTYGRYTQITDNIVHDITGNNGFNNARWGIAVETSATSGNELIRGNKIWNVNVGINLAASCDSNLVSENHITNWDSAGSYMPAIWCFSNYNSIQNNVTEKLFNHGIGITIAGNGAYNFVTNNRHVGTSIGVNLDENASTNTVSNNWAKSISGDGIHVNVSTCVGNKIINNDWSQSSSDITDNGVGTIIAGNIYIDGLYHATSKSGSVALVAGTKAITIAGLTTSSLPFLQLKTPSSASSTIKYQAVCTTNTLTITALVAAGTINASDVSTIYYSVQN